MTVLEKQRPENFNLYEYVKERARSLEAEFSDPDDDWIQLLFCEDAAGQMTMVPLDPLMENKEFLDKHLLPYILKQSNAVKAVLLLNTWMVMPGVEGFTENPMDPDYDPIADMLGGMRPSEHPDRVEALLVHEFTSAGLLQSDCAFIRRHDSKPPTLDEWDPRGVEASGRFCESVVAALAENQTVSI